MAGNVWDWVTDWGDYNYYDNSPGSNPIGPATGEYRVLRGGSWDFYPSYLRSASRNGYAPDGSGYDFGFRCARSD